ncbi:MAG: hypothetical protein QHJ73_19205, partial [Armatimonadota bacterium]|nr:hypothetical protein [Armatimonadota bacterium]
MRALHPRFASLRNRLRGSLPVGFVALLALCTAGAAAAQGSAGPYIRLRYATFDPLRSVPHVPASLRMGPAEPNQSGLYLLQFVGPVRPEWVAALQAQGVTFLGYVPDYAFLTRMTLAQAEGLRWRFRFVRWTGAFHPAYKLDAEAVQTLQPVTLRARTFAPEATLSLANRLKQFGADVLEAAEEQLEVPGSP